MREDSEHILDIEADSDSPFTWGLPKEQGFTGDNIVFFYQIHRCLQVYVRPRAWPQAIIFGMFVHISIISSISFVEYAFLFSQITFQNYFCEQWRHLQSRPCVHGKHLFTIAPGLSAYWRAPHSYHILATAHSRSHCHQISLPPTVYLPPMAHHAARTHAIHTYERRRTSSELNYYIQLHPP